MITFVMYYLTKVRQVKIIITNKTMFPSIMSPSKKRKKSEKSFTAVSVYLPNPLVHKIDRDCALLAIDGHKVSRSNFITQIIENYYMHKEGSRKA